MSGYDTDEDDMDDEEGLEDEEEEDDDDEGWVSDVSGGAEVTVRPIRDRNRFPLALNPDPQP